MTTTRSGSILTPDGWVAGRIAFAERVTAVEGTRTERPTPPYLVPGFIDLHVHGGGGADMMDGEDAIRRAARLHARHGTTALLVTTITAPLDETVAATRAAAAVMDAPMPGEARVLGLHLEGPFINPGRLGAQPPFALPADAAVFARLAAAAPVRVVTVAPECDPDGRLAEAVRAAGARLQIGHSLCDYACARARLQDGWGFTHLYNATGAFSHRGCGPVGAALAHADYAEIIPDLIHVDEGAILAARRAIPNLYGVTDSTAGAGMADGEYRLGRHTVIKKNGAMRLADGTLAGSTLTMDRALANLVAIGLPLAEAAARLAAIPAAWLGEPDRGRLAPGTHADIVALDAALEVTEVIVAGKAIPA
ncbi:MAG: amidohydrolase family protein [Alphaproteobacteria bacterium]